MGRKRKNTTTTAAAEKDTTSTTTTSTAKKVKSDTTVAAVIKQEIEEEEEPEIIPVECSTVKTQVQRKTADTVGSLYASVNSQESFRNAMNSSNEIYRKAPTISNNPYPYRQYPAISEPRNPRPSIPQVNGEPKRQYQRQQLQFEQPQFQQQHPKVLVPRGCAASTRSSNAVVPTFKPQPFLQQRESPHFETSPQFASTSSSSPMSNYRPLAAKTYQPSTSPLLPQYRDKRIRGEQQQQENESLQCPDCNLVLKNAFAYTTHRNYVHGSVIRATIPCPEYGCVVMSSSMVALVRHLNTLHRYSLRHEQHIFKDEDEYMEWFRSLVGDGSTSFIRSSGVKTNENSNGTISLMFYCNHTGRKFLNNKAGSLKMNAVCPAYFRMTKHPSGHVSVYAQLRHLGHECIPKFKTIESFPQMKTSIVRVEIALAKFKNLAKASIPVNYPMEKNSLVSSCLEILNTVTLDMERARSLLDGILPSGKDEEEEYPAFEVN